MGRVAKDRTLWESMAAKNLTDRGTEREIANRQPGPFLQFFLGVQDLHFAFKNGRGSYD